MTLSDFYSTAYESGFSRDYQIRVVDIIINGESINQNSVAKNALNYVKTASIPSRKVEVPTISYHTVKIPVSTGIADFGNKDNYQLTFWADQALNFYSWFYNRTEITKYPLTAPKFPSVLGENIIQIQVLDDMLEPVLEYKLQGVTIKEVSEIKYNKEGSGKPQEFTVSFAYYNITPSTGFATGSTPAAQAGGKQGGFLGALQTITNIAKGISTTARAIGGVATATRGAINTTKGAARAIRGR